jgi:hypothetical protein
VAVAESLRMKELVVSEEAFMALLKVIVIER